MGLSGANIHSDTQERHYGLLSFPILARLLLACKLAVPLYLDIVRLFQEVLVNPNGVSFTFFAGN